MAYAWSVVEFYNATLCRGLLFLGITNKCVATTEGGASGCVISLDIISGYPTGNPGTTALAATGWFFGVLFRHSAILTKPVPRQWTRTVANRSAGFTLRPACRLRINEH